MHGLFAYVWFVILLIGCSLGLPYPEEAVLFGAGYLAAQDGNGVHFLPAVIVCGLGVLLGDSMIYGLGRYVGPPVLQRWPFRKHFTPRRIRRTRAAFLKHGAKLLLPIRVVPVARAVAHFTAGMLSYSYWRFLLWDSIGVILVVPISVWVAWRYGRVVAEAIAERGFWIGLIVGGAVAAWAIWLVLFRRSRDRDPIHEAPTVVIEKPRRIHPPVPPAPPLPPLPPASNGSEADAAKSETAPNEPI